MEHAGSTIPEFLAALGSKDPVPGGGGASALLGAIGTSMASMVGNLTVGKPKYADVEKDVQALIEEAMKLTESFLEFIDEDARAFEPLAKAYGIPKDDPNRDEVMESCLREASRVPLEIMHAAAKAIDIHERMLRIGSSLAISDVGVGVASCKTALQCASLNVFINTKSMKDRLCAAKIDDEANGLLSQYVPKADAVFDAVNERLKGE